MKKVFFFMLALALVFSMVACSGENGDRTPSGSGGNSSNPPAKPNNSNTTTSALESTSEATESTPESTTSTEESTGDFGNLADCLAQFGLTEADITPADPAEINPTVLQKEFIRADIPVSAMPEADTIRAFVEQIYNRTKDVSDDGIIYVSQDKNDIENTRPMVEFTLDGEDFSRGGKTRWGYDYNGTRYFVSITFEYKSRELTPYIFQIKYDWYN